MVTLLLGAKADPDRNVPDRRTAGEVWALRVGVQHGSTEVVRALLHAKASVVPPEQGMLGRAAFGGDDTSAESSILGTAAFKGFVQIAEMLIEAGADVNGRSRDGGPAPFLTPLMHSAYNGHDRIVKVLLDAHAHPNTGHERQTHTALDFAEMQGHDACVGLLEPFRLPPLEDLVRVPRALTRSPDPPDPSVPGHPRARWSLTQRRARIDRRPACDNPVCPQVSCLEKADIPVLERWVERGGFVDHRFTAQMPEGRAQVPLLVYAAMKGQDPVVEWLLAKRADPDAAIVGDPMATEADGHTPLMRACLAGHALVVRRLLRAGAKLAQRSAKGHTALQLAEKARHTDCAKEFKDHLLAVAEESRLAKLERDREKAEAALSTVLDRLSALEVPAGAIAC